MGGDNKPALVALRNRREEVIAALSSHFANDVLGMDEFEHRVELAHGATSVAKLDELLTDLAPAADGEASKALVPTQDSQVAIATRTRKPRVLAVAWGKQRKGVWRVPKDYRVVTVMGGIDLDFREAKLGPGVTEVRVTSVMGAVAIVVPPDLQVECEGRVVLGVFEEMDRSERDPDAPLLRITGLSFMGAVEISTRRVGEPMKLDKNASIGQIGDR